jgi:hypothetical protein
MRPSRGLSFRRRGDAPGGCRSHVGLEKAKPVRVGDLRKRLELEDAEVVRRTCGEPDPASTAAAPQPFLWPPSCLVLAPSCSASAASATFSTALRCALARPIDRPAMVPATAATTMITSAHHGMPKMLLPMRVFRSPGRTTAASLRACDAANPTAAASAPQPPGSTALSFIERADASTQITVGRAVGALDAEADVPRWRGRSADFWPVAHGRSCAQFRCHLDHNTRSLR